MQFVKINNITTKKVRKMNLNVDKVCVKRNFAPNFKYM